MSRVVFGLTEENVRRLYINENQSTIQIAKLLGCHSEAIRKRMKQWAIPMRSRQEAGKNKIFTPEHIEKIRKNAAILNKKQFGENHPAWKGGRYVDSDGYYLIRRKGKTHKEHRYIMEQHIGRKLTRSEDVHHKDRNRLNNDLSNLELLSHTDHLKLHKIEGRRSG